ncbi:MAG: 3-isopropylmalate dehydratase large subunit [Bacteroidetes bacterium]|jgi:3-isopropylmalate/(R)-2-methylmalate dehydratase large subunit|nr:3-isopropylmalate dehydratase large subunit [Bacteroidota bacterium]
MGQTITEKILAQHAGREIAKPGENIWIDVDVLMTHDVCGPPAIEIFKREFGADASVFDPDKLVILPDHYIFTADPHARRNVEILRTFAAEQSLPHYYDVGTTRYKGVCHVALAEEGFNLPGTTLIGTDSHTCTSGAFGMFSTGVGNTDAALIMGTGKIWVRVPETMRFVFEGSLPPYLMAKDLILAVIGDIGVDGGTYRALEFDGEAVFDLSMEERMTLTNMAIEAGGKSGIIAPDQKTFDYLAERTSRAYTPVYGDADARYFLEKVYDVSKMEPVVAKPHSPDNKARVSEVAGTKLDRAYIGSCTGGKIEDFEAAANVLNGHEVKMDTYVVPASSEVTRALYERKIDGKTLWQVFVDAGCKMGHASCGACLGGPVDTFGRTHGTEVVISTTNRNFPGRMGSKQSAVYLASPLTVAASALHGTITDPREVLV